MLNNKSPFSGVQRWSRRQFLKASAAAAVVTLARAGIQLASAGRVRAYQNAAFPNGVASGEVTQNAAVLWAHSTAPGPVAFAVASTDGATVFATLTAEVTDPMVPVKVEVADLAPATAYIFEVMDATGNSVTGHFRTPALRGTYAGLRFGVSGDWRGELAPYPAIKNALERDLAFFVAMGDTIYADFPSPALESPQALTLGEYRIKHNEGYSTRFDTNFFAPLRSNVPFLVTIDDHEVTNDFAGGAPPSYDPRFADFDGAYVNETELYREAIQALFEYNPIRAETWGETGDPVTAHKPKLYRYFTCGSDAAVFVLDNRSFRSAPLERLTNLQNLGEVFAFLNSTYGPGRTLLGKAQLEALMADLRQAQQDGIIWKFVMTPEPIQNLGVAFAEDRFEGYAAERTALLQFIVENQISNVVFVAADIHGTVVNSVTYQVAPLSEPVSTGAFEITTGPVAFDAPFGPTVARLAFNLELISETEYNAYVIGSRAEREAFIRNVIDRQAMLFNYPLVGLDESDAIEATLLQGEWTATTTFGWTEFEIDAETQQLRVTTYGIEPYSRADIEADPAAILGRTPEIVQEFVVNPR